MITINVYPVEVEGVPIKCLSQGDGFVTSLNLVGMIIDDNPHNFTITPRRKREIHKPMSVVMITDGGAIFGVRNGDEMVRPCNVNMDYWERIVQ